MLLATKSEALRNSFGKAFNFPNVHISKGQKPDTVEIKSVVQKINNSQFIALAEMAKEADAELTLKRSGTGVSIQFN